MTAGVVCPSDSCAAQMPAKRQKRGTRGGENGGVQNFFLTAFSEEKHVFAGAREKIFVALRCVGD